MFSADEREPSAAGTWCPVRGYRLSKEDEALCDQLRFAVMPLGLAACVGSSCGMALYKLRTVAQAAEFIDTTFEKWKISCPECLNILKAAQVIEHVRGAQGPKSGTPF